MVVRLYRVKGRGLKEHRTRTCMKHIERKKERKKEAEANEAFTSHIQLQSNGRPYW